MALVISRVEIHFHDQDQASIVLETGATGPMELSAELILFTMFLIRILSNAASSRAAQDASFAFLELSPFLRNPGLMPDLARLIQYPGHLGRKRFYCRVSIRKSGYKYGFSKKGFGFLGRGLQGYSIAAGLLLAQYLVNRRPTDVEYFEALCNTARLCGQFSVNRAIKLYNHYQVGDSILAEVLAPLAERFR